MTQTMKSTAPLWIQEAWVLRLRLPLMPEEEQAQ